MKTKKPVLVIMAAGLGSRYGGLKQIEKITDSGEILMDFSLYDAMMAGFEDVIFIIKRENEADFRKLIDGRAGKYLNVSYAFQDMDDLPNGYEIPEGRKKPWGTCHAVMAARDIIDGPFAVINADDYYGPLAFHIIYEYLETANDEHFYDYVMVGYNIENTLTANGTVSRGVCEVSKDGYLTDIVERTKLSWEDGKIVNQEKNARVEVSKGHRVSMNVWGFTRSFMDEMIARFPSFLDKILKENPIKGEYFLPGVVDQLIKENKAKVRVLSTSDKWQGVTYKEDREPVKNVLEALKDKGEYPDVLWK